MRESQLIQLIKIKEDSVVSVLLLHGLVELIREQDGHTLNNIVPSELGKAYLGNSIMFEDSWFNNLKAKWPPTLRGSLKQVRQSIEKFMDRTGATQDQIDTIVDEWLKKREVPYCGKMENFFYTIDKSGDEISRASDVLEELNTVTHDDDFRLSQA